MSTGHRILPSLVLCLAAIGVVGCTEDLETKAAMVTGGDPARGREEIRRYGCGACHSIPDVPGAHALVGPPLDHMASRAYVAGVRTNTPDNMRAWLMHPQQVKQGTAMPEMGVSERAARDMSAFLYTLE